MKSFLKVLRLDFVPRSTDLALLVLRLWLGLTLLLNHGWGKLSTYGQMVDHFADPLGVGKPVSLGLALFAEVFCSLLLALGLATRFAALALVIFMGVAFLAIHQRVLSGPASGELAFIYLAGFVTILLAGPGRYSVDGKSAG